MRRRMTWLVAPGGAPASRDKPPPDAPVDALADAVAASVPAGVTVRVWPRERTDAHRRDVPADVVVVEDQAGPTAGWVPPAPWRVSGRVTGEVVVPIDGPDDPAATRLVAALHRRAGLDPAGFRAHWLGVHGPLNRDTPAVQAHVARYEQLCCDPDRAGEPGAAPVDGVTVQWFPSPEAFYRFATDRAARAVLAADEDRFLDMGRLVWMLVRGEILRGPARPSSAASPGPRR